MSTSTDTPAQRALRDLQETTDLVLSRLAHGSVLAGLHDAQSWLPRAMDAAMTALVAQAISEGASWQDIGDAAVISRQAAWQRWADKISDYTPAARCACTELGPLLVAPGTSGRSWRCETCGHVWQHDDRANR